MPRSVSIIPATRRKVPNDPTNRMSFDLKRFLDTYPFSLENVEELVTQAVNELLQALEAVTGIDIIDVANKFLLAFGDLDFSSPSAFFESLVQAIGEFFNIDTTGLLGPDSPLNALNLFNLIPTDLLAHIPFSNIGSYVTNLIADPNFLDAEGFSGLEQWFHDATGGFNGTGAAWTNADGTSKELLGNLIPVSAGQVMPISGRALWQGLVGTGLPVALGVTGYGDTGAVTQQVIASHDAQR